MTEELIEEQDERFLRFLAQVNTLAKANGLVACVVALDETDRSVGHAMIGGHKRVARWIRSLIRSQIEDEE